MPSFRGLRLFISLLGLVAAVRAQGSGYGFHPLAGRPLFGSAEGTSAGSADGPGESAQFNFPGSAVVDLNGTVYVTDLMNQTIRKITPSGVVSTLAGSPGQEGSQDGVGSAARFSFPFGLAIDAAGNLYVSDAGNGTIRKVTPTGVVSTFAGTAGVSGANDGTGAVASFAVPAGLCIDRAGNLYVADQLNSIIRKISPAGQVTSIAGKANERGHADGIATAARFDEPGSITIDDAGNVFVGDRTDFTLRKITPAGVVTTLAGQHGVAGTKDGTGSQAQFLLNRGLVTDRRGNLYVADGNDRIRKVTPDGVVTTIVGNYGPDRNVDPPDNRGIFFTTGIGIDIAGNLYVCDGLNNTVRKVVSTTRLVNLSVRSHVGSADQTLTMGFGLAGNGAETILLRGVGPTLGVLGFPNGVADPQLTLFDSGAHPTRQNDNWDGSTRLSQVFTSVGAFPLEAGSKDAAFDVTLTPQLGSAQLTAKDGSDGIALMELYDAGDGTAAHFINASTRATTGGGTNNLIAGFVLSGTAPRTVLIRAVGPSLVKFGVAASSVVPDPKLTLFNGSTNLGENDNWAGDAQLKAVFKKVGAFDLDADTSKDAALLATLDPGAYTVVVSAPNSAAGVALIEIYLVE